MKLEIENYKRDFITIDTDKLVNAINKYNLDIKEIVSNLNIRFYAIRTLRINERVNGIIKTVVIDLDKPMTLDVLLYLVYRYQMTEDYENINFLYELVKEFNELFWNDLENVDIFINGDFFIIDDLEEYVRCYFSEEINDFFEDNESYIKFDYKSYFENKLPIYEDEYYYSDTFESYIRIY